MATYERDQHVEARNFLAPPDWLPGMILAQLPSGFYWVELHFPGGLKANAERRADEIRPLKGDGDAT